MDYSATLKKIKPSIALILCFNAENKLYATGSGFIYGEKGIAVTCNHVVKDASGILIKFPDSEPILGKVAIKDEEHDLALLKFSDDAREPLELEDFDLIKEGMPIIFSGYPLNIQALTTHQGIISAITKDETGIATYLIDGTVNSGNSGCPLMSIEGKVIGIVNAKKREYSDLLAKVEKMSLGALSLHGVDLVQIYQAIINNVQLGIGYAVPASYIPQHQDMPKVEKVEVETPTAQTLNE